MNPLRIEEFKINKKQHSQIQQLLQSCFDTYPIGQSFFNQIPTFRFLFFEKPAQQKGGKELIGHLGVVHRMIYLGKEQVSIFGISDLCVHEDYRDQDIASKLLEELETLGKKHKIDFLILFADEHKFYKKNGFKKRKNNSRWLIINQHQSLGIAQRSLEDSLMIKALNKKKWNNETVDFLGSLF